MEKIINLIKYIIIGIIQGISEILPISSSAHLAITYKLLNINNQNQFDLTIFLHFASCLALCIFFKDELIDMIVGFIKYVLKKDKTCKDSFMLFVYLIIATIPSVIVGLLIKPLVENSFNNFILIGINLFITGLILLTFLFFKKNTNNTYNFKNTFVVGLFQCLAMFPGISRSGITLFGSKISRLNNKLGKQFSFLLLIPISFGSFILSLLDLSSYTFDVSNFYLYVISMIVTFIFTLLSLRLFFTKSHKVPYHYYSIYLFFLSLIVIFLFNNYF